MFREFTHLHNLLHASELRMQLSKLLVHLGPDALWYLSSALPAISSMHLSCESFSGRSSIFSKSCSLLLFIIHCQVLDYPWIPLILFRLHGAKANAALTKTWSSPPDADSALKPSNQLWQPLDDPTIQIVSRLPEVNTLAFWLVIIMSHLFRRQFNSLMQNVAVYIHPFLIFLPQLCPHCTRLLHRHVKSQKDITQTLHFPPICTSVHILWWLPHLHVFLLGFKSCRRWHVLWHREDRHGSSQLTSE